MEGARITVAMVQRDHFSMAERAIRHLFDVTDTPFDFVYVDGRSPRSVRRALDKLHAELGFLLLRSRHYLTPNQARAVALREVITPYVAFVDNDCLPQPGWLGFLLEAAEDTNAWVVGPLYAEGDPEPYRIHMAGGDIDLSGEPGDRHFEESHRLAHARLGDLTTPLCRQRCDILEFHCMLARTEALRRIGGLDEQLLTLEEHLDVCMRVTQSGGEVWFEPRAVVTFAFPPELKLMDVPYFALRWSERWTDATIDHFCTKYGLDGEYRLHGGEVARNIRQNALFEPPRALAGRVFGARGWRIANVVLRKTVGHVEPTLNRLLVHRRRLPLDVERIGSVSR